MTSYTAAPNDSATIIIVEDDPDAARFVQRALDLAGFEVVSFSRPDEALEALKRLPCSLLLSDVRLPAMTGLDLLQRARRYEPQLPVVLMTAFATLEDATFALRNGADDYLLKPLNAKVLIDTVSKVLAKCRAARDRVLAIGAHPDDVEIGVGATLIDHVDRGDHVTILTLSRGESGGAVADRTEEAKRAAELIGAALILGDLPDTRISTNGPTVDLIEDAVRRLAPMVVYTHSLHDVHQDHRAVHQASLVACRAVPQVFSYQSPSATVDFAPHRFVPVDAAIDRKLAAIAAYRSQKTKCSYLADDLLRATARYWGRFVESDHAEPLEIVRQQVMTRSNSESTQRTIDLREVAGDVLSSS